MRIELAASVIAMGVAVGAGCAPSPAPTTPDVVVSVAAPGSAQAAPPLPAPVHDVRDEDMTLAFFEVDDTVEPWKAPGPTGRHDIQVVEETVWVSDTAMVTRHFAKVEVSGGESLDDARERLLSFARGVSLPPGRRFGLQKNLGTNDGDQLGWRTFVLLGEAVLTDANIATARVEQSPDQPGALILHMRFDEAGARILSEVTARSLRRRLAIVVDGVVQSAPVVMSPIDGGQAQIYLPDTPLSDIPDQLASGVRIEKPR